MTAAATMKAMPLLPQAGGKVRWRNPEAARARGWESIFGAGPFVVVGTVDHSSNHLATGLILGTALGEQEISEVWLALADDPEDDCGSGGAKKHVYSQLPAPTSEHCLRSDGGDSPGTTGRQQS